MEFEMTSEKSASMVQVKALAIPERQRGYLFKAQLLFRILAILSTSGAISRIVTSDQTVLEFGIVLTARYSYSSAFKFLLVANAIVLAFSMLSLLLVVIMNSPKSNPKNYFYLFLHDIVVMVLMISGCAAATAVGYVGRFGENEIGWVPICDRVGKYCDKVMLSVALSYLAWFCVFALTIMSAYKASLRPQN